MEESAPAEDLLKVPVSKLRIGMFVQAIENNGRVNIANAGQIRTKDALAKLIKSGIKFVWVDVERSSEGSGLKKKAAAPLKPKKNRDVQQQKAQALLGEAKDLIRKVLSETFEGKAVEVAPVEAFADNMIETVLQDADAFKCVSALRTKDAYLLEHSVNVAFLLVTFGKHIGLDKSMLAQLAAGGIMHDVGKVKVDDKILNKPGRLTEEEFEHMKMHQTFAKEIMREAEGFSQISQDVCLMHHEKLDGTGYPNGLKGDELPMHARMSCIADIYDALTATRCYKEAMSPAAAFKILLSLTPHHLDQKLVYEFVRCVGVYPAGSLVELSDGRVGIVWESKDRDALHPVVKCFYSLKHKRYTDVAMIDMKKSELNIERGVSPSSLDVDPTPFY